MDNLSIGVIIAQIINFWILFFIFYYFLGAKLVAIIAERKEKLEALEWSDDKIKQKLEEAEKQVEEIISNAKRDALEIQKNANELSKRDTAKKLEDAQQKAKSILDVALKDIEKERLSMTEAMKDKVLNLSLKINEKVFWDENSNKNFVEKELASLKV